MKTYLRVYEHTSEYVDIPLSRSTYLNMDISEEYMDITENIWTYLKVYGHSSECMDIPQCMDITLSVWT